MCVPCFVVHCFVSFLLCNHFDGEERADCFTLFAFLVSCYNYCSVALQRGVMGLSAVCDYGISWSCLLYLWNCKGSDEHAHQQSTTRTNTARILKDVRHTVLDN